MMGGFFARLGNIIPVPFGILHLPHHVSNDILPNNHVFSLTWNDKNVDGHLAAKKLHIQLICVYHLGIV